MVSSWIFCVLNDLWVVWWHKWVNLLFELFCKCFFSRKKYWNLVKYSWPDIPTTLYQNLSCNRRIVCIFFNIHTLSILIKIKLLSSRVLVWVGWPMLLIVFVEVQVHQALAGRLKHRVCCLFIYLMYFLLIYFFKSISFLYLNVSFFLFNFKTRFIVFLFNLKILDIL